MKVMKSYNILIFLILALTCNFSIAYAKKTDQYTFGVFPHMPVLKIIKVYQPIASNFTTQLNKRVTLSIQKNFNDYENSLKQGIYDIAFIQPFDYVHAKKAGYLPVATRDGPLKTVLVVDKSSSIKSIKELNDKTIAYPPINAAVTRIIQRTLKKNNINSKAVYTKNHFSCMQQVLINQATACATAVRALFYFENIKIKNRLKIIYNAESISHALFVVHSRLPEKDRNKLKNIILNWHKSELGLKILSKIKLKQFKEATDAEYIKLKSW